MADRRSKRDKVLSKSTRKTTPGWVIPAALVALVIVGAGIQTAVRKPSNLPSGAQTSGVDYAQNSVIQQTPITTAVLAGGKITVPLADIKANKLVGFIYNGQQQLPLLAYIAPSGTVVTAVSMCEPCNSVTFHIEGDQLVCNTCGTRWSLEGLRGIAGGCTAYPPDAFGNTLEGDQVVIPEAAVATWKRRI